jgi:hypothetical protein
MSGTRPESGRGGGGGADASGRNSQLVAGGAVAAAACGWGQENLKKKTSLFWDYFV